METNEIHQGKAIEKLLEKSGLSVTKFAHQFFAGLNKVISVKNYAVDIASDII